MADDEPPRSRTARAAAEAALVGVVHHYGTRPEFVVLGGLVPELLCSTALVRHAGTTDIDVQVDLEIASGSVNTARLERALLNAEFEPDNERVWRWRADTRNGPAIVKFELLADLENHRTQATIIFDECDHLGAVNLRGTRFAARDVTIRVLVSRIGGLLHRAEVNVTGLAGFLLAKTAAANARRKPKDWYDIAYVLVHNDLGGPLDAATAVRARFAADLPSQHSALVDLAANFADPTAQGPSAYADQMQIDQPESDPRTLRADAVIAVQTFLDQLLER